MLMVLLRVVDAAQEGWKWMPFEQFLERVDLASWKDGQQLVGMVLPHTGQSAREARGMTTREAPGYSSRRAH